MSLWGSKDYPSGNQKPVFANTSNVTSASTINGAKANSAKYYGIVAGVSVTEQERSNNTPQHPAHAGWVSLKVGTGPVAKITASGGSGINAAGFITFTDGSVVGSGAGLNASFTIANSQNTLQASSTNSAWNTISSITIVDGGSGFTKASDVTLDLTGDYTSLPTFTVTLGGRGGRIQTETLIAMGSITLDAPSDNAYFTGT